MTEEFLSLEELQFIKDHKKDLQQNNIDQLYWDIHLAFNAEHKPIYASHFTRFFLSKGIDPLKYFKQEHIYPKFAVHVLELNGIITIPDSIEFIGANAFTLCTNITKVICKSVTHIDTGAFMDCHKLKDIDLGNALDTIAQDAFADTCIETLVLPKTLRVVKTNAFNGMSQLTKLVFEGVPDFIEKNAIIQNEPHKMIIEVPWTREFEQEKIKKKDWQRGWVADRRNCKVVYKG